MESTVEEYPACNQCSFNGHGCQGGKLACEKCGKLFPRCHINQEGTCEWCDKD